METPQFTAIETRRDARIEVVSGDHQVSFVVEEPTPHQVDALLAAFLRLNRAVDEVFNNTTFVKDA